MRYRYCPYDAGHYATNLRWDAAAKRLKWDSAKSQQVLIVQTPYGREASEQMEEICELLEKNDAAEEQGYTEIAAGISVRFISSLEKAKKSGCEINGGASTYSLFACQMEDDECRIFAPQNQAMISANCSIPLELEIETSEIKRATGALWFRREESSGFWAVTFRKDVSASYVDGDLFYTVEGLDIPITKQMIRNQRIYIQTGSRPEIRSGNKGIRIHLDNR